jgi:4-alpha-glucanotransferase
LLSEQQLGAAGHQIPTPGYVNYDQARSLKQPLLTAAFAKFQTNGTDDLRRSFDDFCERNEFWLIDFARFDALSADFGEPDWSRWEADLVHREPSALAAVDDRLREEIQFAKFQQWVFAIQWKKLKAYANERSVRIYGDMPIFVAYESVDVWTNQELFVLDDTGRPVVVAGVPPDYFSADGQMWGNPLYRWDRLAETGYEWWISRFRQAFECYDMLRIDHFRGFESYWEIPADAENAIGGQWQHGPLGAPFDAARAVLGELPIVAEDLGLITDEVHALRERLGFPGMRVLQFGCDHDHDPYHRPDHYPQHSVAYTGTHDNDTVIGWYQQRCKNGVDNHILSRFLSGDPDQVHTDLIRAVLNSAADTAVIPMQDLLGLGSRSRINTPGEPEGNWRWRCLPTSVTQQLTESLLAMTEQSGRRLV